MEMCGSIAEARRYNSSASGWSAESDSTRAITRRWSVILSPLSTQAFSIRVTDCSLSPEDNRLSEIGGQRKPEHQRVPAVIIAFARANLGESQSGVQRERTGIVGAHFQEHGDDAQAARLVDSRLQQCASKTLSPRLGPNRQRQDLGLVGSHAGDDKAVNSCKGESARICEHGRQGVRIPGALETNGMEGRERRGAGGGIEEQNVRQ